MTPAASFRPIYLDYNATTPVHDTVKARIVEALETFGNPSSSHAYGRRASESLASARRAVAESLGATDAEIVFTSGGTESNNLALFGVAHHAQRGRIVTCEGEHPSVLQAASQLETSGFEVVRVRIDKSGQVDPADIAAAINRGTILVSVMHANNETGTIQPIEEISRVTRHAGVPFHCDAAQSIGKIAVDVARLGVDLLTVAGHKLYAPKGVGVLYVRAGTKLSPYLFGGAQEDGRRAGTPAIHQAAGFSEACQLLRTEPATRAEQLRALRDRLHARLREAIPQISLNGHPIDRLPNTLNLNFPLVHGADLLAAAPNVAASTGSACHEGSHRLSPVLAAMQVNPEVGRGAVRLSLGLPTTADEVDRAAGNLVEAYRRVVK